MNAVSGTPSEIRGLLIPLERYSLLLPNAAVAEIIDYRELQPAGGLPQCVAGVIEWRHRKLPVIQFERLLGLSQVQASQRRRIMACHSLQAKAQRPFIGILSRAIPRLVRVTRDQLQGEPLAPELADAPIAAALRFDGQPALIPDLTRLEQLLSVS